MKLQPLLESKEQAFDVATQISEITGDYWAERGMWKEGTAEII